LTVYCSQIQGEDPKHFGQAVSVGENRRTRTPPSSGRCGEGAA